MPSVQFMRHCSNCDRKTLHVQQKESNLFHLVLTILTAGLWLIVWIFAPLRAASPQCTVCGETWWSSLWKRNVSSEVPGSRRTSERKKFELRTEAHSPLNGASQGSGDKHAWKWIAAALAMLIVWSVWPDRPERTKGEAGIEVETSEAPAGSATANLKAVTVTDQKEEADTTAASPEEKLFVAKAVVNVRAAPSTGAEIVAKLKRNTEVVEVRREGEWVSVTVPSENGTGGWIYALLLTSTEIPPDEGEPGYVTCEVDDAWALRSALYEVGMTRTHDHTVLSSGVSVEAWRGPGGNAVLFVDGTKICSFVDFTIYSKPPPKGTAYVNCTRFPTEVIDIAKTATEAFRHWTKAIGENLVYYHRSIKDQSIHSVVFENGPVSCQLAWYEMRLHINQ